MLYPKLCYNQNHVITNHVIKRLRCLFLNPNIFHLDRNFKMVSKMAASHGSMNFSSYSKYHLKSLITKGTMEFDLPWILISVLQSR